MALLKALPTVKCLMRGLLFAAFFGFVSGLKQLADKLVGVKMLRVVFGGPKFNKTTDGPRNSITERLCGWHAKHVNTIGKCQTRLYG